MKKRKTGYYEVIQSDQLIHFKSQNYAQCLDIAWVLTKKGLVVDIVWRDGDDPANPLTVHDVNYPL